jgi:uncharacterized membrane protein YdjX (TVP38/TMEM64 family)
MNSAMTARPHPDPAGPPAVEPARRTPWWDFGFTFTAKQAWVLLALLALGVLVTYGVDWAVSQFIDLDEKRIEAWVHGFGALGPLVLVAIEAGTVVFTPVPTVPIDIAGGLAFGVFPGTLYVLTGAMIGATIDFYLARRLGRGFVERKLGRRVMESIDSVAIRMGAKLIFFTRLCPLFNFKWVSYAAGLTRIPYRTYAVWSLLGTLGPTIAILYVGEVLVSHPTRSALVFTALVVWSAVPPVAFLLFAGYRAVHRRVRGTSRAGVRE